MIGPVELSNDNTSAQQNIIAPLVYRAGSMYQCIFEKLYINSVLKGGISRDRLVEEVKAATGKEDQLIKYATSIVCSSASPEEWKPCHRSCHPEKYYVEKMGNFLTLVMRKSALAKAQ